MKINISRIGLIVTIANNPGSYFASKETDFQCVWGFLHGFFCLLIVWGLFGVSLFLFFVRFVVVVFIWFGLVWFGCLVGFDFVLGFCLFVCFSFSFFTFIFLRYNMDKGSH